MKFKILFTSKNNYELLENWINHCHGFSLPEIINLDLFSSKIQKSMGKALRMLTVAGQLNLQEKQNNTSNTDKSKIHQINKFCGVQEGGRGV